MCGSITVYREYEDCVLKTGSNDGFIARFTRTGANPGAPHQIVLTTIHRCSNVISGPPKSTCSSIVDLMPEGVMKAAAYSAYDGPCPACVAAMNSAREACFQTQYVSPYF